MTDKSNKKLHGVYAEFGAVDPLLAACRRVRDAGYVKTDAFTPFPVHGIDKALGIKPTALPWIALACGLTGTVIGVFMQVFMNTFDYPYIISGKPFFSMPAFIPVSFELTILLASFGAFFGMLALNGLPKFSNPIFTDPGFDRATDDKFFLYIDSADPRFNHKGAARLLTDAGGVNLVDVYEDGTSTQSPKWLWIVLGSVIFLSMIPLLIAARMRVTNSSKPRFHVFYDMDFSPAKEAQMTTSLFADGRSMRPDVPGTVAVGQFDQDLDFYSGIDMDELARRDAGRAERLVRAMLYPDAPQDATAPEAPAAEEQPEAVPASEQPPADDKPTDSVPADDKPAVEPASEAAPAEPVPSAAPAAETQPTEVKPADVPPEEPALSPAAASAAAATVEDTTPWLRKNPLDLSVQVVERGRAQFDIYCATCHGNDGRGNGLVNRRAQRILSTAWVQPSSLHQDTLYQDVYPDGKLFSTISNGIRKMSGYGSQITARDRWAIVAYVRALQESQNADADDLPVDKRDELKKLKAEVDAKLAAAVEAEQKKAAEAELKRAEAARQNPAAAAPKANP